MNFTLGLPSGVDIDYKVLEEVHVASFELMEHMSHKSSFAVDYTPLNRSKSWTEKMYSAHIAARCGGKTQAALKCWIDECDKLFPRKQTKLLQSKSKQSRIIRVVIR